MDRWPDDVLLIHYAELGSSPDERLHLLGAISVLFDKPANFYTPAMLSLSAKEWNTIHTWLSKGNAIHFWHLEVHGIQITNSCKQHLLIGTSQMLADLRNVGTKHLSSRQLLENIWTAAFRYVESEIMKGSEVISG